MLLNNAINFLRGNYQGSSGYTGSAGGYLNPDWRPKVDEGFFGAWDHRPNSAIGDSENAGSSTGYDNMDPTGFEQAQWELDKQMELLAEQRAYNSAEAEKNRQWQEMMSNTAIQRQVKDLEAAGLNKWLALNGGSVGGSSTPSGSAATSSAGDASAPNPALLRTLYEFYAKIATSVIKVLDLF